MASPTAREVVQTLNSVLPSSLKSPHMVYSVGRVNNYEYLVRQIPVETARRPVNLTQLPLGGLHNVEHFTAIGNLLEELKGADARTARCDPHGFLSTFIIRMDGRSPPWVTAAVSDWHENDALQVVSEVVKVFAEINPPLVTSAYAMIQSALLSRPLITAAEAVKVFHRIHRQILPTMDMMVFTIYRNRTCMRARCLKAQATPLFLGD